MCVITQSELRRTLSTVLREVHAGRTLVIARRGVPAAELRPVAAGTFVSRAVAADAARRAPRIDAGQFVRDVDAVVESTPLG